ncbi:MAG: cell division protein FtsZ [Candidatus Puniceispirillaceae bacterium]
MTINLTMPQTTQELRPKITVVGVGGAGCNAVNNMISADLEGVEFLVANTDGQALAHSLAPRKIQLGTGLTRGLGAGSKPEMGRRAAEESLEEVMAELADSHMVFITAGMGGGTGTGAAPVIAKAARDAGILTVGVITKPFEFEGQRRMAQAEDGISELQGFVDTLIVIPNQNLFRLANERTTFADAFHMADTVLHQGVCGVTDLMIKPGMINLDFADIRAVMSEMGKAMMGTGEASGDNRATEAAEAAINNPLLDDTSMKGANALLINITGGMDMTLFEVDEAANRIRKEVDADAVIIFGSAFDEKMEGVMRVSVVATGIDAMAQTGSLPFQSDLQPAPQPVFHQPAQPVVHDVPQPVFQASTDFAEAETNSMTDAPEAPAEHTEEVQMQDATDQLDLEEVVGLAHADSSPAEQVDTDDSSLFEMPSSETQELRETEDMQPISRADAASDSLPAKTEEKAEAKPVFIPAPVVETQGDEMIATTQTTAESQRGGLIGRISGLWSSRPEPVPQPAAAAQPATAEAGKTAQFPLGRSAEAKPEDAKQETAQTVPMLDLGQLAIQSEKAEQAPMNVSQPEEEDMDELDIPAFLRRQAN